MNYQKNSTRLDVFVVWANGFDYLKQILDIIKKRHQVVFVEDIERDTTEDLVNTVYKCDSVPLEHLRGKTKYLTNLPPKAVFVLVNNPYPEEVEAGEGEFRHKQSMYMVRTKGVIRAYYNPQEHHHVVHGTDYAEQTEYLLREFFPNVHPRIPEINVLRLLEPCSDYCIIRKRDLFPMYTPGDDVDILCADRPKFVNELGGYKCYHTPERTHIDFPDLRLDLVSDFQDAPGLAEEVLRTIRWHCGTYVPSKEYDRILRGHEFFLHPEKKKHQEFLKDYKLWHDSCGS